MAELISIVIPVYNMADSLEAAVRSILAQEYTPKEIILVDDGSQDRSLNICRQFEQSHPEVKVIHTENRGSGPARNIGIAHATGRYIYFPDADDQLEPGALTVMAEAMQDGDCDLVVFGYHSTDSNGQPAGTKRFPDMIRSGEDIRQDYGDYVNASARYAIQGAPWNKFFDLNVIRDNHVLFPPLRRHQDDAFIGRYMCHVHKVRFISKVLYSHGLNDIRKVWNKFPKDYLECVIGLYEIRKQTILTWNSEDIRTRQLIEQEYISRVIKAMELSFSPRLELDAAQRKQRILETANKAGIARMECPPTMGNYQKRIVRLLKNSHFFAAVLMMRIKVLVERNGLLAMVKGGRSRK